jgi:hypothetical protein
VSGNPRVRDQLRTWGPWWLSDRHYTNGKTVAFRFLWTMIATLDCYLEYVLQALLAAWPGAGTPTALPLIGRSRGIMRGQADTDEEFQAKLRAWLEKWAGAGTQRQLAIEIHEYLGNHPRVRVVNRAGRMVTVNADGTVTTAQIDWDWDSVSHPERAGFWSELFVIVYPTQWAHAGTWGDGSLWGDGAGLGIGHDVTRVEVDAIKGIVEQWKAAHSKVRAIIWTSDATLFDPAVPASLPDGEWGSWGTTGGGSRVPSHRDTTSCRYWEM